ncbi:MAG: hypothetical protein JEY99_14320 [Spirochaetales bacterium]|nr:hypothetical protein [Spirochaetales bacterium]
MKMKMKFSAILVSSILLLILISGCATIGISREEEVQGAIRLIDAGDADALKASSRLPFLLDGEVILGESELNLLWEGLSAAGFSFHNPVIDEVFPAEPEHYTLFGDSMDVEVYFKKYLQAKDAIVLFHAEEGAFVLILSSRKTGSKIAALGGGV